jgi:hypothetical protein
MKCTGKFPLHGAPTGQSWLGTASGISGIQLPKIDNSSKPKPNSGRSTGGSLVASLCKTDDPRVPPAGWTEACPLETLRAGRGKRDGAKAIPVTNRSQWLLNLSPLYSFARPGGHSCPLLPALHVCRCGAAQASSKTGPIIVSFPGPAMPP